MSFEPGCSVENEFCAAPELAYAGTAAGCATAPGRGRLALPGFACALIVCVMRVRRRRVGHRLSCTRLIAAMLIVLLPGAVASAEDGAALAAKAAASTPVTPASPPSAFALAAELGAAIDQASAAVAAGARYRADERWLVGADLEWNPWASLETGRVRAGTFNASATLIWRAPLSTDVTLRVAGRLGAAWLLFDLYGAPSGSVGPYAGISLLALELGLGQHLTLVLEPADVVVAMPHVTGIPLTRRQYRASVALEWWL
jgi:hypothetical protein